MRVRAGRGLLSGVAVLALAALPTACGGDPAPSQPVPPGTAATPHPGTGQPPGAETAAIPADVVPRPDGTIEVVAPDGFTRTVEPERAGHLRVWVLSGGGWHDFAKNLHALLPTVAQIQSMTFTELPLGPEDLARPTSLRMLEAGDLSAECDVLLVYTQGDLALPDGLFEKLVGFVRGGGGLVALHCALDSFPEEAHAATWQALVGGRFERHPPYGEVLVQVVLPGHPIVARLPSPWLLKDEFYHLKDVTADRLELVTGVSPEGGAVRPVAWTREEGRGRVAATILGHGVDTHGDPDYQRLVAQMLAWAAGD